MSFDEFLAWDSGDHTGLRWQLVDGEPVAMAPARQNHAKTRVNIWTYMTLPSVQEILVVSSVRIEAELLRRRDDGSWPEQPEAIHADDAVELASIGFTTPLAVLYRTTSLAR